MGNTSSSFVSSIETNITAWIYQFYKLADWSWLYKNGISDNLKFDTIATTSNYTMNTATCGFELNVTNVESVYAITSGNERRLIKRELADLRVGDPGLTTPSTPYFWAPFGRQGIQLYPTPIGIETIYIDGKVHGSEVNSNVTLPVPYDTQELFFQFCLVKCLRRERDPRSKEELATFAAMLKLEVAANMTDLESALRFKTVNEAMGDENTQDLESRLWNA